MAAINQFHDMNSRAANICQSSGYVQVCISRVVLTSEHSIVGWNPAWEVLSGVSRARWLFWCCLRCWGSFASRSVDGDDLSASYIGCRLLASENAGHLYAHDPVDFSDPGTDAAWTSTAEQAQFDGTLHPYVQTPLWAIGLRPLCTRLDFPWFKRVFAAIAMVCFAGSIWLIALCWAPSLLNPVGMTITVVLLWFSVPFQYAMVLMQTHVVFFAMTIGALILAEQRRPGWAGLLLAGAAAVKLTPGVLVVYWLMTKRWKAAVSTVVWSVVIGGVTLLLAGRELTSTYVAEIHRISQVLLLAMNNQSLAAWWMGWFYPAAIATHNTIQPLPVFLRLTSVALMVGVTALGGWSDRRGEGAAMGSMIGLIAATVFAPIAWTHYAIVLLAPLMMLWHENQQDRRWAVWAAMAAIVLLSYRPLAADVIQWQAGRYSVVRSEFYACIVCIAVIASLGRLRRVAKLVETDSIDESGQSQQLSAVA